MTLEQVQIRMKQIHRFIAENIKDHMKKKIPLFICLEHKVRMKEKDQDQWCGCPLSDDQVFFIKSPRTDEWNGAYNMFQFLWSWIMELEDSAGK